MFLEYASDVRPHLLEVLLTVSREEGGKGALLSEGVGHVPCFELLYLPMVNGVIIPCCGEGYKIKVKILPRIVNLNSYLVVQSSQINLTYVCPFYISFSSVDRLQHRCRQL